MQNLAEVFLKLTQEDLSVLSSIEAGMRDHEWVPLSEIVRSSGLSTRKVEHRLCLLSEQKLISWEPMHYKGYQIDFDAYDLLALANLVKRNYLTCIGEKIGVGKEAVVFEALGEIPLVIKFYREGRTSFKHVRRVRDHLKDLPNISWLHSASLAARREFQVMTKLYPQVSIPRPVALSRHAVVMEFVPGTQLNKVALINPLDCMEMILDEVKAAYGLDVVHADLSEYNVIVTSGGLKIIDWPQAVNVDQPGALEALKRDVGNIVKFFDRRYRIEMSLVDALVRVKAVAVKKEAG